MGALQIDTIHVVARSPYLVLFSRLGAYQPAWLDELLRRRRIFEYWAHAACFLPIEDYALYRRRMLEQIRGFTARNGASSNRAGRDRPGARARQRRGALGRFRKPEGRRGAGGTGRSRSMPWSAGSGELMVARRENFQRVYDLRERVLPGWDDAGTPPLEHVYRELTLHTVQALGIALPAWVPDYFRLPKGETRAAAEGPGRRRAAAGGGGGGLEGAGHW